MVLSNQADILDQVAQIYPKIYTCLSTTVDKRTEEAPQSHSFGHVQDFLRQYNVEEVIWFTAVHVFERMYHSVSRGVQLYDVPSSGNVFHSVELTISTALLTILYDGTETNPCPVDAHLRRMQQWSSLMSTVHNGTYETFTREVYWAAIYGMRKRSDLLRALVLNTSTCSERDIWETPTSRRAIQFAHYNANPIATQWLNAGVAMQ